MVTHLGAPPEPALSSDEITRAHVSLVIRPTPRITAAGADLRRSRSFLHWIVCGIDVRDAPRPYPVHLNDRLLFRPAKVVRLGRHDGNASRRQWFGLCHIELVAGPEVERAGNHRDMLDRRVRMSRDLVVRRKLEPKRKGNRVGWWPFDDGDFCPRRQGRYVRPLEIGRRDHDVSAALSPARGRSEAAGC